MNVNLELLRTSKITALTKAYLADAALQLLYEQDRAIAAAAETYRDDWRKVCNALHTSPDSPIETILAKIERLQEMAHSPAAAIRARNE